VERRRISSGSPYEPAVGFSRALVAGRHVYVAGTAPIPPDGSPPPDGAYEQARLCLELIGRALEQADAGFEHVVRTRIWVRAREHWDEAARAHAEVFGEIRPAATGLVNELLDPRWLVEIEADALLE
jgi:enamine deaminase RidA (YjgF/YER057c/UK114 family)